jgi:LEA14-like dessication related protein
MLKILAALASKNINFSFDAIIKASNPNQKSVSLDKLDYIILLEGNEIAMGSLNQKFVIPAKSNDLVSIKVNIDALKLIERTTIDDVFRLYQNITGKNTQKSSLLSVKLKPTINQYTFPSFITIKKEI